MLCAWFVDSSTEAFLIPRFSLPSSISQSPPLYPQPQPGGKEGVGKEGKIAARNWLWRLRRRCRKRKEGRRVLFLLLEDFYTFPSLLLSWRLSSAHFFSPLSFPSLVCGMRVSGRSKKSGKSGEEGREEGGRGTKYWQFMRQGLEGRGSW